jgi:CRP/FNR family transcriptional regulator, cyclic AMP receptor protein
VNINGDDFDDLVGLMSDVDPDARRELAALARVHPYPKGNILFYDGEPADAVFIVVDGKVKISFISDEGREVVLAVIRSGGTAGLLGALDERAAHVGTAITITDSRLARVPRNAYLGWFDRHSDLHRGLLGKFAHMLADAYTKIGHQALLPVKQRLLATLVDIARADGRPDGDDEAGENQIVFVRPTHQELADMIGSTRVVVSRLLKELVKEEDAIAEGGGKVMRVSVQRVLQSDAQV